MAQENRGGWKRFTGLFEWLWKPGGPFPLFTMVNPACFAHTDWGGTREGNCARSVISLAERAGAVWSRLDRRRTGVVLRWTSSVMWNCGKVHGKQLQTTHARRPVSWMPMSMLKTIRTGIRSRDNKEAGGAGSERSPFAVLRWSAGYAARGVRDEPLGRNPSGGMAARNPICRMWAEGKKRLLSETRKP